MAITFKQGGEAAKKDAPKRAEGRSALLYGPPFSGKTSTLQNDPSVRTLLIDFDKNSGVLARASNVDVLGVSSYDEYLSVKEGVRSGKLNLGGQAVTMDYDLYCVDSLTSFEESIKSYVVTSYAPERRREIKTKFGAQTDWADLQDHEVGEIRDWQQMTRRANNPINILWLGHDMESKDSSEFLKKMQVRLQGKYASPGIMSAVDALLYMTKVVNPKNPDELAFGIYTMDTQLSQTVTLQAAARVPVEERKALPKVIWNPKWGEVFKMLGAVK